MQTDSNVEKSRPFHSLLHWENLLEPVERILGPPVCLPMSCLLTPWAEEAGRPPQEPLCVWGGVGIEAGSRNEKRSVSKAGSRL